MRRDLHNWIKPSANIPITQVTIASTAIDGTIIDTQGFSALEFLLFSGAFSSGTLTPTLIWGNESDLSDGIAIDADHLFGTLADATFTSANANSVKKIGVYLTTYRYVRLTLTPEDGATAAFISVASLLTAPNLMPTT